MSINKKYPLLVILGPTAVGKTKLSIEIAQKLNGEIISADSMQIYRKMNIGTAKAGKEEREIVKHHFIDIINPDQKFSVADYKKHVDILIPQIIKRNKFPILVGGTGLYIKAVLEGFLFPEFKGNFTLRRKLKKEAEKYGNSYLHAKLASIDSELAKKLHQNDIRRIIRGIEVFEETGKTMSYYYKKQKGTPKRYNFLKIGLIRDRDKLYQRINQRVDLMIKEGLVEEVKKLLIEGYEFSLTALQGLGYKEVIGYLNGQYDLAEAIYLLKRNTRHYAKRQVTWFKRDKDIHWFNLTSTKYDEVIKEIFSLLKDLS